jgi:DHA1 family bicyclomycin/chloramphenicol resistance-like MFS transporter
VQITQIRGLPNPARRTMGRLRHARLALVIGGLSAFGALTIDMYLPAMPIMAGDLHTRAGLVQLTLTAFVIGLAVGQVVVGPLSDAYGRRRLLLAGLTVYVAGSLACLFAPTISWLIAGRLVQSAGAAAATVLSRAIVRDLFEGRAMTRFFSTLMLVNGVAPIVAPVIGGQLLNLALWRLIFLVLTLVGTVLLVVVILALPESLPADRMQSTGRRIHLRRYAQLVSDRSYLRYVLAAALMFASMFAYISGSSFVLQDIYGLTAQQYSLVFGSNGLGIVVMGQINGRLVGRLASEKTLLGVALGLGAVGGFGVLVSTIAGLSLSVLLVGLFVVVSMFGPVAANATSLALADHGSAAGTASALQGLLQFLIGGLVASGLGAFGAGSAIPMGAAICLTATAALAVFATGFRADRLLGGRCQSV